MKKNQDKKTGKSAALRRANAKKLHLSDGWRQKTYTSDELVELLHISRAHAYRIIKDPEQLTPTLKELLIYKTMGAIPSFGAGWYLVEDGLSAPNGYVFSPVDLENWTMVQQLLALAHADNRKLQEQVAELLERVEHLQARLSTPDHLRKWNNPKVVHYDFTKRKTGSEG